MTIVAEMASIGGLDLAIGNKEFAAGVSWRLNESPRGSHSRVIAQIEVRLAADIPYVVALARSHDPETFEAQAYAAVQKALDLLAIQEFERLTTPDAFLNFVHWWREDERVNLGIVRTVDVRAISSVSVEVRDSATGAVKPPDRAPAPEWHPTFRYFRTSQTADDVFDSYRNLYLALEAIVSTHVLTERTASARQREDGRGKPTHLGERRWLKVALRAIGQEIDLLPYVDDGPALPHNRLFAEQYEACRCALFHAKAERRPLLPGEAEDREVVSKAAEQLGRLVVALIQHYLHLSPSSGVLTYAGFAAQMAAGGPHVTVWASEQPGPPGRIGAVPDSGATRLSTTYLRQVDDHGAAHAFLGELAVAQAGSSTIRRLGTQIAAGVALPLPLPTMFDCAVTIDDLDYSGSDRFVVTLVRLLNNVQAARTQFTY
jgi:hypothetical protein